jgi:hypothetical protein
VRTENSIFRTLVSPSQLERIWPPLNAAKLALIAGTMILLLGVAMKEARGGNFVALKEGTPVTVKLMEDFDAAALKGGDKVPMVVAEKVESEGFFLVDAGTSVEATFMPGNTTGKSAGLLNISSVEAIDGQYVMLRAEPEAPEAVGDEDAAAHHPILLPEESRRMPKGTTFTVYISESSLIED